MRAPRIERRSLLSIEAVTLIDANHARTRARRVAEHRLDGLQVDAELLEAGGYRAAQIVDAPVFDF